MTISQLVGPLSALVLFGGLGMLLVAAVLCLWTCLSGRGTRRVVLAAVALASFCVGALATIAGGALAMNDREIEFALDEPALVRVMQRAEPLIHAIESFIARTGRSPDSLDQLALADIRAISATGWSAHPNFKYQRHDGGDWKLFVPVGKFFAWDEFVYDPNVTQPAERGCIVRVGDWYYAFE